MMKNPTKCQIHQNPILLSNFMQDEIPSSLPKKVETNLLNTNSSSPDKKKRKHMSPNFSNQSEVIVRR